MNLNLTYLDPPQYGWTAIGGISSILEPHEAARRGITAAKATVSSDKSGAPADIDDEGGTKEECYYTILEEDEEEKKEEAEQKETTEEHEPSRPSRRKSTKEKTTADKPESKEKTDDKKAIEEKEEKAAEPEEPKPKQISIQTTKDNVLDIYTYHRGRVGQEPRDARGNLLAITDAIDTNHDYKPPSSTIIKITLDFPFDDEGSYKFHDVIPWDLSDPTLNVEEFSTSLATSYDLSFKTTMEIIQSITSQIQTHVLKSKMNFYPPIVIRDVYNNDRPDRQFPCADDAVGECFGRREDATVNEGRKGGSGAGGRDRVVSINRREKKRRDRKSEGGSGRARPMGAVKPQRGTVEIIPKDKVPKPNSSNDPYAAEVLRRAQLESQQIASECKSRGDEVLWLAKNEVCHICHNRKPTVLTFHCGSHSFCDYHCASRLSFRVNDYDPKNPEHPIDYCPVCTLQCTCSKCTRRLETVKDKLKAACDDQGGCRPVDVNMRNGVLILCNAKLTSVPKNRVERKPTPHGGGSFRDAGVASKKKDLNGGDRKRSRSRGGDDSELVMSSGERPAKKMRRQSSLLMKPKTKVLKLNPTEFPRELHEGKDKDPSEPGDGEQFFVPAGTTVPTEPMAVEQKYQDIISIPLTSPSNISYCIVCEAGGDGKMTECNKCPRSYHADCLVKDRRNAEPDESCPRCRTDQSVLPEDDESLHNPPTHHFVKERFAIHAAKHAFELKLLELIVEVVNKLKTYDFGAIFAVPVNVEEAPGYDQVVKNPMDYGTIMKKLEGGRYPNPEIYFTREMNEIDQILLHVICDIEQVHHNCMTFNQKGSSFFRIGEVHSIKWNTFYEKYISERLSDIVKANLEEFRAKCKQEREGPQVRILSSNPAGRHANKIIGVYDPDTKKVVKQYTSKAAAVRAVEHLVEAGYDCEYAFGEVTTKTILDKVTKNQALLLGYRWIAMDRLRSGNFLLQDPAVDNTIVIWKEDTVSGHKQGFYSEDAAHKDWLDAREVAVASVDPSIGEDLASFRQHFVDGVNTINGVAWNHAASADAALIDIVESKESAVEQGGDATMEEESGEAPPTLSATSTMD